MKLQQIAHNHLIEPHSANIDSRSQEVVLNFILVGFIALTLASITGVAFEVLNQNRAYLIYRLLGLGLVLGIFLGLLWLSRRHQRQRFASIVVLGIIFSLACVIVYIWGILTPTGLLLFSLSIVISGILFGSRFSLIVATSSGFVLLGFELLKDRGTIQPNVIWMKESSNFGDVFAFSIIFVVIALISWLFNRQMEASLQRARKSEKALNRQKRLLEVKVEERTRQLAAAQFEKVQQIYRFAELGRISSALFHDLANHLSTVSLNIEGLAPAGKNEIIQRVQNDIHYIDDVVQKVRLQLRGQRQFEQFNIVKEIQLVINILHYKLVQNHLQIEFSPPKKSVIITSDITRFRQIITNLLNNAIDAYDQKSKHHKPISIDIVTNPEFITLKVTDAGRGISPQRQQKIFEPFYSNKKDGSGIGLFIVRQIVEKDIGGSISVSSRIGGKTSFIVTLPTNVRNS